MFSGIIQACLPVEQLIATSTGARLSLKLPQKILAGLQEGASLAINGVCLTVLEVRQEKVVFDLIKETLKKSNLSSLQQGDLVNIERSLKLGDEIGGHLLSGHIFGVVQFLRQKNNLHYFELVAAMRPYLFSKGFVALNGVSLTLVTVTSQEFSVAFIPHTLKNSNFSRLKKGQKINLEIDSSTQLIVETTKNLIAKISPHLQEGK